MIVNILNGLLNDQIAGEQIINWLTSDKPHDVVFPDVVQTESLRAEFVLFFLEYLRKQCPGIEQNPVQEADPAAPKKPLEETPQEGASKPVQKAQGHTNATCHTSTPVKTPSTHRRSFENRSSSFNTSMQSSPIVKKVQTSTVTSLDQSSRLDNSSDSLNTSVPFIPVSPLYGGPPPRVQPRQNQSLDLSHQNFPSFNERSFHRSQNGGNRSNDRHNPSPNTSNHQKSGNHTSGGKKTQTIQLGDFLVLSTTKKSSRKSNSKNQSAVSVENASGEDLGEKSGQKKKNNWSKRRIKPTKVEVVGEKPQPEVFGIISRPETKNPKFMDAQTSEEVISLETERELLKLERQRNLKANEIVESAQEAKVNKAVALTTSSMTADPSLVDNVEILFKLAHVYGELICKKLVPNPMTELYFIVTLLTCQVKQGETFKHLKESLGCENLDQSPEEEAIQEVLDCSKKYLNTSHNCVYFAALVLDSQRHLLDILDRPAINFLLDHPRIKAFRPTLGAYLTILYDHKVEESTHFKENLDVRSNVCFQIDTDNQQNFASNASFSKFRMQRDLFYDALKTWEDRNQSSSFNFNAVLERKINALLSMHDDALNYYHLARLFKAQLLTSCLQLQEDPIDNETLKLLKSLKSMNLEKFKQLQERLTTPATSSGPVPQPMFSGVQEFYRDFILTSNNTKFNTVLENCFIQEMMELNETSFTPGDLDCVFDEATKQKYLICVSSLRLLAKFLGFLVSLPFRSTSASLVTTNAQIALRSQVTPSLNLMSCLYNAISKKRLTVAVPWMVEYLANLDPVALRLPYYSQVCETLYYLYRTAEQHMNARAALLITFSIGWLFELPNFPRDLYFIWQSNFNDEKLKKITSLADGALVIKKNGDSQSLDKMDIVDDRVIHVCCPFVRELRTLLVSGNSNFSSSMNRHITPVSSQLSQPSNETKAKVLQLQQEDAFFHGQPDSVKKTVDFVSERIASNCVKVICREILPAIKVKHFGRYRKMLTKKIVNSPDYSAKREKNMHQQFINGGNGRSMINAITKDLREESKDKVIVGCRPKCGQSLEPLLADDTHPAVKEMCVKICTRMAVERVNQWLDFYVNDAASSKELVSEYMTWSPKEEINKDREVQHNPEAPAPTEMITLIRSSIWELLEKSGRWSTRDEATVLGILKGLDQTLNERKDLQAGVEKVLYTLSVDYAFHLIVYDDELLTPTVLNAFVSIWKQYKGELDTLFLGILSNRNIHMLQLAAKSDVWCKLGKFINRLIKEDLLTIEDYSDQCVWLLRRDWPTSVTKFLPDCLNEAMKGLKPSDMEDEKVTMMLDWIANCCRDFDGAEGGDFDYGDDSSVNSVN